MTAPRMKLGLILCALAMGVFAPRIAIADDDADGNDFYVGNRAPLLESPFMKLPVGAVKPHGWVRTELQLQADGFHGHLTEISRFLRKENNAWLDAQGDGDHGWEEVPYWLKGYISAAYILDDPEMIKEAQIWIEGAIRSQKADGWFGPDEGRTGVAGVNVGRDDLWPNMVMLFCLQTYYEKTQDPRVLELMKSYFAWEMTVPEEKFLPPYWQQQRAADNLHSVLWLYNRTGDESLLELAHKIHRNTADWTTGLANWHNVNIAQAFGGPATYYPLSKDQKHLDAAYRNWAEIRELYGQVPGGMYGSDENCRPGYVGPRQAVETCGMVEEMLSDETLLCITGDPIWGDRCETTAFNSLPAAFLPNLNGLRYLTSPNHVLSDRRNKNPGIQNGGPMFLYSPHDHRCCQHNAGHGWPYFIEHLWVAAPGNGLAAALYAPCEATAKVADGTEVTIVETTDYPFRDTVEFEIRSPKKVRFPLQLRLPEWCEKPTITIDGQPFTGPMKPGTFATLDQEWSDGAHIVLHLPMKTEIVRWTENKNSATVVRGPLTYSLKIGEEYLRDGGTDEYPEIEVRPTTPWNYGLVLEGDDPAAAMEVIERPMPEGQPFEATVAPIVILAKAKRIPNWTTDSRGLVGKMQQSPIRSDEPTETIELIPMGAAHLRISAFPVIGDGPDANEWPRSPGADRKIEASHCYDGDTVEALCDGALPSDSNDHSIPRTTWWPRKGTDEWVSYGFDKPRTISAMDVYWFDDTGRGECRVPASWTAEYLDGDAWRPIKGVEFGVAKDRFNKIAFDPVTTTGVRLKVKLRDDVSGGILEWRVNPK